MTATSALKASVAANGIAMPVTADRTHKTVRPLNFVEILETCFLVWETLNKLAETQSIFIRHNWHHLYDDIIYQNSSVILD